MDTITHEKKKEKKKRKAQAGVTSKPSELGNNHLKLPFEL